MSRFARPISAVATFAAVALAASTVTAVAATEPGPDGARPSGQRSQAPRTLPAVATGLIVKTSSGKVSSSLRKQADRLTGAAVAGTRAATGDVTVVGFDEPVSLAEAQKAADGIAERSDVEYAVPDRRLYPLGKPPVNVNDPKFGKQRGVWDGRNLKTAVKFPDGGYSVHAPQLWRKTKGSPSVVVAVVDTGIRKSHPEFSGQLVSGYDMVSDFVDAGEGVTVSYDANDSVKGRDADPSDPGDWYTSGDCGTYPDGTPIEGSPSSWHGSHVAGIIAAKPNNKTGITGIAPGVKVQPVRALGRCGGSTSDVNAAMLWAAGVPVAGTTPNPTPAKVINLSLGGPGPCDAQTQSTVDQVRAKGATLVVAAGNEHAPISGSSPGNCKGVVAVAATDELGQRATYSNYGSAVDLSAPGGEFSDKIFYGEGDPDNSDSYISGTGVENQGTYYGIASTIDKGMTGPAGPTYAPYVGTSMSAPAVAAGAGLLYSLGPYPANASASSRIGAGLKTAVTRFPKYTRGQAKRFVPSTSKYGTGILNLGKIPVPLGAPWVSGVKRVGVSLTAVPRWQGSPSFRYQWLRNGTEIAKATRRTYKPTSADQGKKLQVRVTGSRTHYTTLRTTSRGYTIGKRQVSAKVALKLSRSRAVYKKHSVTLKAITNTKGGSVIFYDGRKKLKTVRFSGRAAVYRAGTSRLKPGSHRIKAVFYPRNDAYKKTKSSAKIVRVRR